MKPVYWNNINSCLKQLRYDGRCRLFSLLLLAVSHMKRCGKLDKCVGGYNRNINFLEKRDLIIQDYRIHPTGTQRVEIVRILRSIGFLKMDEGWDDYYRYMLRLFLNPSKELMGLILKERKALGPAKYQIGAHVRCGGVLADVNEETAMVTPAILKKVPGMIQGLIDKSSIPKDKLYVYLSTDSSIAAETIKKALSPVPVNVTTILKKGHTETALVDDNALKGSILDLILGAESKSLLVSSESGFSRVMMWMDETKEVSIINAPYVYLKGVDYGKKVDAMYHYNQSAVLRPSSVRILSVDDREMKKADSSCGDAFFFPLFHV